MSTFTNRATLTYKGKTTNSNIVKGEIADLIKLTKTSINECYFKGCESTFIISIINTGEAPLNDLTISDDLGAYNFSTSKKLMPLSYVENSLRFFINGVQEKEPDVDNKYFLKITNISIPPKSNAMLIYRTNITEYAPLSKFSSIENTAVLSGTCLGDEILATETITACREPKLEITKALSPTTVVNNGQITYTLTILNYGNKEASAEDNVVITDIFKPILNPISVIFNNESWREPNNYQYSNDTGLFETLPGKITVPAAEFTQDKETGIWSTIPGSSTLTITGKI